MHLSYQLVACGLFLKVWASVLSNNLHLSQIAMLLSGLMLDDLVSRCLTSWAQLAGSNVAAILVGLMKGSEGPMMYVCNLAGSRLPSEELAGKLPVGEPEAMSSRAYLSNVCVAPCMRKQVSPIALPSWFLACASSIAFCQLDGIAWS